MGSENILVSFDVVSLFTMVPVQVLVHMGELEDITALFQHVLTTAYFQWDVRKLGCPLQADRQCCHGESSKPNGGQFLRPSLKRWLYNLHH